MVNPETLTEAHIGRRIMFTGNRNPQTGSIVSNETRYDETLQKELIYITIDNEGKWWARPEDCHFINDRNEGIMDE